MVVSFPYKVEKCRTMNIPLSDMELGVVVSSSGSTAVVKDKDGGGLKDILPSVSVATSLSTRTLSCSGEVSVRKGSTASSSSSPSPSDSLSPSVLSSSSSSSWKGIRSGARDHQHLTKLF